MWGRRVRVQEFARGGAQNLKAFFFYFLISRGAQAPCPPPLEHAPGGGGGVRMPSPLQSRKLLY